MSNPNFMTKPLVFTGLMVCICAFLTLFFPQNFSIILIALISTTVFCIFLCVVKSQFTLIPFIILPLIIGCILPYNAYLKYEASAKEFTKEFSKEAHIYSAKVDSSSYSSDTSYSEFFVTITHVDEKPLSTFHKAKLSSFSGDYAKKGDKIHFSGICMGISELDKSVFDYENHLRSKRIFINFENAKILSSESGTDKSFITKLSSLIEKRLFKYIPENYNYDSTYVAKALLLGDKSSLTKPLKESFKRAGLSHILCVSGMHLSIILGFISQALRKLTVHKKIIGISVIGFCVFYMFFTGLSPSVIRAGIMACVTYTAFIYGRSGDSFISLFLASSIMILQNPYVVLDISAQLSFVATLGVITVSLLFLENRTYKKGLLNEILGFIITAVLINTGAVCFTLPLSAFSFGTVSLVSFVSTLCVSLLCELSLILLLFLSFISFIPNLRFICTFFGSMCNFLIQTTIRISDYFAKFEFSYIPVDASGTVIIPYLICIIICVLLICFDKKFLAKCFLCIMVLYSVSLGIVFLSNHINSDNNSDIKDYGKIKDTYSLSSIYTKE